MAKSTSAGAKLSMIMSMVIFGTIGIFVRYISYSSGILAMSRGFIGVFFLLLFLKFRHKTISMESIKQNGLILTLSGAFIGINWILLFEAYRYTTVATATLCYYLAPILVIALSPFIFKEKLTPLRITAVIMALVGMVFVSGVYQGIGGGSGDFAGILLGIGAAVFYASVIICNKKLKDIDAYSQTAVQLFMAGVVLIPYNLITGGFAKVPEQTDVKAVLLLLFVGIVHTGLAYVLYFGSTQTLSAQTLAIFSYIDPVVAILVSAFVLMEGMSVYGIIGAVLILGSTLLTNFENK